MGMTKEIFMATAKEWYEKANSATSSFLRWLADACGWIVNTGHSFTVMAALFILICAGLIWLL